MTVQIERERKFLVNHDVDPGSWSIPYTVTRISQTYLRQTREGAVERIRVQERGGQVDIILCMKENLDPGTNRETESIVDISSVEMMLLQEKADPTRGTIHKIRYTFDWNDLTYELDVFEEPRLENALLEVEVDDLSQTIEIPPFLIDRDHGVCEVTGDPTWTNHQISLDASSIDL